MKLNDFDLKSFLRFTMVAKTYLEISASFFILCFQQDEPFIDIFSYFAFDAWIFTKLTISLALFAAIVRNEFQNETVFPFFSIRNEINYQKFSNLLHCLRFGLQVKLLELILRNVFDWTEENRHRIFVRIQHCFTRSCHRIQCYFQVI